MKKEENRQFEAKVDVKREDFTVLCAILLDLKDGTTRICIKGTVKLQTFLELSMMSTP